MHGVPDCLNRRNKVLDELINEINTVMPVSIGKSGNSCCNKDAPVTDSSPASSTGKDDVGIKLMCDFWKILEDNPDCDLKQEVQKRMCRDDCRGKCRLVVKKPDRNRSESSHSLCCSKSKRSHDSSITTIRKPKKHDCGATSENYPKGRDDESLRKVLGDLRSAASFEKNCSDRVEELTTVQKELLEQIRNLEDKEKKEAALLKEADCMWSCMEDQYQNKVAEAKERYQLMQNELNDIEVSADKWRKIKRDLESQIKDLNKCNEDNKVKIIQKENDVKVMKMEIDAFKKRIDSHTKDLTAAKNSYNSKKDASDARLNRLAKEMEKFQKQYREDKEFNEDKEKEGNTSIKDVREDLQKLCRCLLQKQIENEDLRAETEALVHEVELLKKACKTCRDRCTRREKNILEESTRIDQEISKFTLECIRCHKETNSADVTGYCTDCPRCLISRECLNEGDHCTTDHTQDCICTRVKQQFLNNVFENMYTVLEKQVHACPGKELGDCILKCLQKSRNGKLDDETRKVLQDFILSAVKQNLNLTIVGGAVKTRCEMEPEAYQRLMLCLHDVTVTKPVKADKGTVPKKLPCTRWNYSSECNCPRGPKSCVCARTAPKPSTAPSTCGGRPQEEEEMVHVPYIKICPKSNQRTQACTFSSNMRAAQCVLGPEALADLRAQESPSPGVGMNATSIRGSKKVNSCRTEKRHQRENVDDNFNMGRNASYQKHVKKEQLALSPTDSTLTRDKPGRIKPVSSLQKAILFSDQQQEKILDELIKNKVKQNETKEQSKIPFKNYQSKYEFTKLTQTTSGKLAIELDKRTIKIMEEKSITDPYLYIVIKPTRSGHVSVKFDTKKDRENNNCHRVKLRKTSSGTRLLDINKILIKKLKDTLSNKIPNVGLSKTIELRPSPERSIEVDSGSDKNEIENKEPQPQDSKNLNFHTENKKDEGVLYSSLKTTATGPILTEIFMPFKQNNEEELRTNNCSCKLVIDKNLMLKDIKGNTITYKHALLKKKKKESPTCSCNKSKKSLAGCWKSCKSKYRTEFQHLYKQGNANVAVEIKFENGVVRNLPAVIKKTKRGSIGIYVKDMISLKEISFDGNKCPVQLSKAFSGTYCIRCGNNDQSFNATLLKTPSKGMLLIPQSYKKKHRNRHEVEDIFKVSLCVMRNQLLELPAILRPTRSNNYIVVLDKEFEKCYKQTVQEYFGDKFEGSVDLQITSSGNYLLELDNKDESHIGKKKRNAWLVKTSSGNIKVIVRPEFQSMFKRELSIRSNLSMQSSAKTNCNLPASSRELYIDNLKKSASDTQSIGKLKVKLQDDLSLLSESSPNLEKNSSGQYAVVIKESKKSLLNSLPSDSLTRNLEKVVPIKRSDSEEIIIKLNNTDESKTHYGTLKITPSGNFYVAVDDDVIRDLTDSSAKNDALSSTVGTRSKHATQLIESVRKSVATTCQHKAGVCASDPFECVCAGMAFDSMDGSMQNLCPCSKEEACANDNANIFGPIPSTSMDDSALIHIDPSFETAVSQIGSQKNYFTEQCYYMINSSPHYRPHSKDDICHKHSILPEEILELVVNSEQLTGQNACQVWDSLNYLPQQLPHFLRQVNS